MTDQTYADNPDFDALGALWQSEEPIVPTEELVARLRRHNRRLRQLNQVSFVSCIFLVAITLLLEIGGRLPTGGLLSAGGTIMLFFSWWKYRRDKARLIAAYSEDPDKLLPFLIKRTKAARNLGRYYYLTPLPSVVFGFVWARLMPGCKPCRCECGLALSVRVPLDWPPCSG